MCGKTNQIMDYETRAELRMKKGGKYLIKTTDDSQADGGNIQARNEEMKRKETGG